MGKKSGPGSGKNNPGHIFENLESILCNGGALYAPYSFLRFSNMLCDGRVLARWGVEGGNRVVKLLYDPVFRVIK